MIRRAIGAALGFVWGMLVCAFAIAVLFVLFGWRGVNY